MVEVPEHSKWFAGEPTCAAWTARFVGPPGGGGLNGGLGL